MKPVRTAIRLFLFLTFITGAVYPALVLGLGQAIFPKQSGGSLIIKGGQVIGSELISQKFVNGAYFWGRPSSADFNPLPSGGSNLGPTNQALKKSYESHISDLRRAHEVSETTPVPQELAFASASGLDPEISEEAAVFQIDRILKSRGLIRDGGAVSASLERQKLIDTIRALKQQPDLGFLGESRVNVLKLNLATDELFGRPQLPPAKVTPAG